MTAYDILRADAEYGWKELSTALEGVTQGQAWAQQPNLGPDYLHTDATIHGIALHVASTKWMYASIAFRQTEIRWSQVADQLESFEPDWNAAMDYLRKGHEYWMASWEGFTEVETPVATNYGDDRPMWKLIQIMSQHDSYHAGQIAMLRYGVPESDVKPPSCAEDVRTYCRESSAW